MSCSPSRSADTAAVGVAPNLGSCLRLILDRDCHIKHKIQLQPVLGALHPGRRDAGAARHGPDRRDSSGLPPCRHPSAVPQPRRSAHEPEALATRGASLLRPRPKLVLATTDRYRTKRAPHGSINCSAIGSSNACTVCNTCCDSPIPTAVRDSKLHACVP